MLHKVLEKVDQRSKQCYPQKMISMQRYAYKIEVKNKVSRHEFAAARFPAVTMLDDLVV